MANIVFIHGMWSHGGVAEPLRKRLEKSGHRVCAPNLPGHDSGNPLSLTEVGQLSIRDYVDSVESYIAEQYFYEPPVLIGHSMGGLIAQMVAARVQVAGIALLNSAAPAGINHIFPSPAWSFRKTLFTPGFWNRAHLPSLVNARDGLFCEVDPDIAKDIHQSLVPESGRSFFEIVFWWLDKKKTTCLEDSLDVPIFIISSGRDKIVDPSVALSLVKRYPESDFQLFPENGHWIFHEEGAERIYEAIELWIEAICDEDLGFVVDSHHFPVEQRQPESPSPLPSRHTALSGGSPDEAFSGIGSETAETAEITLLPR